MPHYISLACSLEVRQNLLIAEGQWPGTRRQKESNVADGVGNPSALALICYGDL